MKIVLLKWLPHLPEVNELTGTLDYTMYVYGYLAGEPYIAMTLNN